MCKALKGDKVFQAGYDVNDLVKFPKPVTINQLCNGFLSSQ